MEKQGDNRRSVTSDFAGKNKLLIKCIGKTVNVMLLLAKCNLRFCGYSEELSKDNKGHFLSIIQLLAKYDTVLDKLLQLPKDSPKYLSPLIQNKLILVLAEKVLCDINSKLLYKALLFLRLSLIPLKMTQY